MGYGELSSSSKGVKEQRARRNSYVCSDTILAKFQPVDIVPHLSSPQSPPQFGYNKKLLYDLVPTTTEPIVSNEASSSPLPERICNCETCWGLGVWGGDCPFDTLTGEIVFEFLAQLELSKSEEEEDGQGQASLPESGMADIEMT